MGHTVEVDDQIYNALISSVGKEHLEKRLGELLLASIEGILVDCTRKILSFEESMALHFQRLKVSGTVLLMRTSTPTRWKQTTLTGK